MAGYVLGIDAGGSHTRAVLASATGELLGFGLAGAANFRTRPFAEAAREIQMAVQQAKPKGITAVDIAWIGSAALEEPGAEAEARLLLGEEIKVKQAVLDTDAYSAWAGALKLQPGVVVIAGTGSMCLALSSHRERFRLGGWGPLFGDEGSAYSIANKTIREALKSLDARQYHDELLGLLLAFAGLEQLPEAELAKALVAWLYDAETSSTKIAGLASQLDLLASRGHQAATTIFRDAAKELAARVSSMPRQFALDMPLKLSVAGSVFKSAVFKEAFREQLAGDFCFLKPAFPPVMGSLILGFLAAYGGVSAGLYQRLSRNLGRLDKALFS